MKTLTYSQILQVAGGRTLELITRFPADGISDSCVQEVNFAFGSMANHTFSLEQGGAYISGHCTQAEVSIFERHHRMTPPVSIQFID